jgi:hypothetical protein
MIEFAVPIPEAPAGADPEYDDRRQLVEGRREGQPQMSRPATVIGTVAEEAVFSRTFDGSNVVSLFSGLTFDRVQGKAKYHLDEGLAQFQDAITIAATYKHSMYPTAVYRSDHRVDLSVRQDEVEPHSSQSDTYIHRDHMWHEWSHIYIVSDACPTEFFEVDPPGTDQYNREYGEFKAEELSEPFVPQPYEVVFTNNTSLHRSPIMEEGGRRTFLRLVYEHAL